MTSNLAFITATDRGGGEESGRQLKLVLIAKLGGIGVRDCGFPTFYFLHESGYPFFITTQIRFWVR